MTSSNIDNLKNKYDSANMFEVIKNFPAQMAEAIEIGRNSPKFKTEDLKGNFAILGMGGSAIGGSIVKSYFGALEGAKHLNMNIIRNYNLPGFTLKDYNFIACSHSGNTEETLSAFNEARKVTSNLYCLTSGGNMRDIADKEDIPAAIIPGGFQPRCALAYSIFPLLYIFINNKLISKESITKIEESITEITSLIGNRSKDYSNYNSDNNKALNIAAKLHKTVPVIYSADERLDSINIRWRNQIQENAKNLAFGGFLPEMNHNEVNGWTITENGVSKESISNFSAIILGDKEDHPRVSLRYDFLKSILMGKVKDIIELSGEGNNLLTRMIDLIYLADWVSYYLALLNNTDPTPIPMINDLKDILARN